MITALHNMKVVSAGRISRRVAILIEGGIIIDVVEQEKIPKGVNKIDLKGAYIAPGLIDLQIYGSGKPLFFGGDPSAAALTQMEASLLAQGCTGFLATIATNTNDIVERG